ncbi:MULTISPECIES: cell envelope biogenesis protein OmpA [unclassified Olleya]|uniref:cell envelope biogenesis protein OmpA n=1 Tax=unclassified Olleya TaxID=2615019 RepID=UPI000C3190C8|nr:MULTISPECIES: cell envelope biogenesis protein OmpA [unclassified Olleya]AUC74373.1 cell envelope biogenesis protein OmpA [Olleya sp. Bg11-27]QXP60287.1 cell envelope biogenesis protein OmpA [Olleya sp. HaHaR_3_96]
MLSTIKHYCIILMTVFAVSTASAQLETSKWKALISVGINSPSQEGLVTPFEANTINFPTINLGLQRMFTPQLGAKLDFGYNRFANADDTPEFKTNYTRINLQFVYDGTRFFSFLPIDTGVVFHIGPGYSMIKPLGDYGDNKTSFLNGMAGLEFHYGLSRSVSAFIDASYIYGFGKDFDPITEGFGSFNGNLLTVTVGVAVSLSGCYTCN